MGPSEAYTDVAACYDYNDSLHIVWTAAYYDSVLGVTSNDANLYHWSKATGISMIASGYWGGTKPGGWNRNISKMSISALDPVYHPGGDPDSVFLYCIWTQFDTGDTAANGYGNGDIYGAASSNGGANWGPAYSFTNTKTPGCAPGACLSEHWPSLAQNLDNGNLHIQYICDRDAGGVIMTPQEGSWTENPVMYLELQTWLPANPQLTAKFCADPTFGCPPLVVQFMDLSIGNPATWLWDFGDNSTSTAQSPIHMYNDTGYFDVKLVISNGAQTDSIIKDNYIHIFPPTVANFSAEPDSGCVPFQVQFTDLSEGNPISWLWDFGDNSTSTSQHPVHTYNDTGYFDVKLVVSNQHCVDSLIKQDYIHHRWFERGDVNADGVLNAADVVYLINYLFISGPVPVPCLNAGDVNCDGTINAADVVYLINYLYINGPPPCD